MAHEPRKAPAKWLEAMQRINDERRHPEGITPAPYKIAMSQEEHEAFTALKPIERGELIRQALGRGIDR